MSVAGSERSWRVLHRSHTFTVQQGFVQALDFPADGSLLASASSDSTVQVWELEGGEEVQVVGSAGPPNSTLATSVALHPEGELLAYASRGRVFVRDWATGASVKAIDTGARRVSALRFDRRGEELILVTQDPGSVQLFEVADWRRRFNVAIEWEPEAVAIDPSGDHYAVAIPCKALQRGDARKGRSIRAIRARMLDLRLCGEYFAAAFSPDLTLAANATDGPEIYRWNLETGRALGKLENPRGGSNLEGVTALAFEPGDRFLAAGTVDGRIELWDWSSESLVGELFEVTPSDVAHIAFSRDRRLMAVGDWYGVVRVVELEWPDV